MKQQNPANTPRGSNITNYFVKLPLYAIHKNYNVNSMLHVICTVAYNVTLGNIASTQRLLNVNLIYLSAHL